MKLRTIGYEAATQGAVIDCLQAAGVEVLIDVRAVASSRRAGFSKTLLAASLAEAGIDYVHLRGARHAQGRAGRRSAPGAVAEMVAIYEAHLAEPQAQLRARRGAGHRPRAAGRAALLRGRRGALPPAHRRRAADARTMRSRWRT